MSVGPEPKHLAAACKKLQDCLPWTRGSREGCVWQPVIGRRTDLQRVVQLQRPIRASQSTVSLVEAEMLDSLEPSSQL